MSAVCKKFLLCVLFLAVSALVAAQAMPHDPQDYPDDDCCNEGRGPPGRGGGPPGGARGPPPPGPPPGGMPQRGQQTSSTPINNYYNITLPATIVINYNGSSLTLGPRPPNATAPNPPIMPNSTAPIPLPPNATVPLPNRLLPNATALTGLPLNATTIKLAPPSFNSPPPQIKQF